MAALGNKYRGVSLSLECVCGGHLDLVPGDESAGGLTRQTEGWGCSQEEHQASGAQPALQSLRGDKGTGNA